MKWSCDIVRDLIPGYVDGLSSGESRAAVEEHVGACADCRAELESAQRDIPAPEFKENDRVDYLKTVRSYARKESVRAVLGLVLAVLACFALYVGYHWFTSAEAGDTAGLLRAAEEDGKDWQVVDVQQKGPFLSILRIDSLHGGSDLLVMDRDKVFPERYRGSGGTSAGDGKMGSFNFGQYGTEALMIMFGVNLPEKAAAYTFYNNGVFYTRPITDHSYVLDMYYLVGQNDIGGSPVLVDADGNEIPNSNASAPMPMPD